MPCPDSRSGAGFRRAALDISSQVLIVPCIARNEGRTMGQLLHGSATTTAAVRRAIQHSQESLRSLAKHYGVNQKIVAKWKQRSSAADRPTGPRHPHSTSLSAEDEAIIVAFRRHTLLALDDCLYALQPSLPHLTRSSLHRCLQRHGISRLPEADSAQTAKKLLFPGTRYGGFRDNTEKSLLLLFSEKKALLRLPMMRQHQPVPRRNLHRKAACRRR